jgi:hypothetical protein
MSVNVCFRDAAAYTVSVPPAGALVDAEPGVAESVPQPVSMTNRTAETAPTIDWVRVTMQTLWDLM